MDLCVEVRGQLVSVCFLLSLCRSLGLNSGHRLDNNALPLSYPPAPNKKEWKKRRQAGDVVQVVEHLLSMHQVLAGSPASKNLAESCTSRVPAPGSGSRRVRSSRSSLLSVGLSSARDTETMTQTSSLDKNRVGVGGGSRGVALELFCLCIYHLLKL